MRIQAVSRGRANQAEGAKLEAYFAYEARMAGLFCVQNGVQVKHLRGGKVACIPSNLDWLLIKPSPAGARVAIIDTKSFNRKSFGLSLINPRQLVLAQKYAQLGVVSGFVVALRAIDSIVFFDAHALRPQYGRSFGPNQGVVLGRPSRFDLNLVFDRPTSSPQPS